MKYLLVFLIILGILAPSAKAETLRLTPDKSELLRLKQDAVSIIVGNPAHLSVLAENPHLLVLIPKEPGATYFTALDAEGHIIQEEHVIIASPKENYVRIRRSCDGQDSDNCEKTSVFYCQDMCHSIKISHAEQATTQAASPALTEQQGAENYQPAPNNREPDSD